MIYLKILYAKLNHHFNLTFGGFMNSKLVQEAPYYPGYEDASFEASENPMVTELNQYRKMNTRYMETAKKIVEFLGSGSKATA